MRRRFTVFCLTALLAGPLSAQTFRAENGVRVMPAQGGFLVTGDAGFGAQGRWCAASDYARRVLGARGTERVYVAQGRTPGIGQRSAVLFTLDPAGLTPTRVTIVGASLRTAGANLSVDHAHIFCADSRLRNR